jgi:enolase-phosphatase E1
LSAQALQCSVEEVVSVLEGFIDRDVKNAELKRIQGKIWAVGYMEGILKGHVYEDVPQAFRRWNEQGKKVGIYSSGSVQAQKLIYGHSIFGDLRVYIDDHFDLAQGYKYEVESYLNIVKALNLPSESILFLSDVEAELDAARLAGMDTIRILRDEIMETKHRAEQDFASILS